MNSTRSYKKEWKEWFGIRWDQAVEDREEEKFSDTGHWNDIDHYDALSLDRAWEYAERDFEEFRKDNDLGNLMTFEGFKREFKL